MTSNLSDLRDYLLGDDFNKLVEHAAALDRNSEVVSAHLSVIAGVADFVPFAIANAQDLANITNYDSSARQIRGFLEDAVSELAGRPAEVPAKIQRAVSPAEQLRRDLLPYAHANPTEASKLATHVSEARKLRREAEKAKDAAEAAFDAASKAADRIATRGLIADFDDNAASHRNAAWLWAVVAAVGTVGFVLAAAVLLGAIQLEAINLPKLGADAPTSDVVAFVSLRLAVLGLLAVLVLFALRNYRSNRHMQVSFQIRGAVVLTATSLSDTVPEARETIYAALVTSVFPVGDTGFQARSASADGASSIVALPSPGAIPRQGS